MSLSALEPGDMIRLSREEAQTSIYRGCARLAMAMQIKRIAKDAAQKWEDEALREAYTVIAAARDGPLIDLVVPPLPFALIEVQERLHGRRPMRPLDIHSPFEQASSSPLAIWITDEDDPEIPSNIGLGDPGTFWWTDMEEKVTKVCTSNDEDSEEDPPPVSDSQVVAKQRHSASASEPGPSSRPSKRYRADPASDDESGGLYVYDPKCGSCNDRGLVCRAVRLGHACTPCKIRKGRCSESAYRRGGSVVKRSGAVTVMPVKKKPRVAEKSIVEMFRSKVGTSANGGEMTPTTTERKGTGSVTCPPSKHQRAFVAIPPLVSKPCVRPVEQPNVGPPGGKWKWQKRAERVAAARISSTDSSDLLSRSTTVTSAPVKRTSASAPVATPTSTPVPDASSTTPGRVLVDKGVATENPPLGRHKFLKALASFILEYEVG